MVMSYIFYYFSILVLRRDTLWCPVLSVPRTKEIWVNIQLTYYQSLMLIPQPS